MFFLKLKFSDMKNAILSLIFLATVSLDAVSCQTPACPETIGELKKEFTAVIARFQKKHVRESYGEWAGQCFTWVDLESFKAQGIPAQVKSKLKQDVAFSQLAKCLSELSADAWADIREAGLNHFKPTWAEQGEVSRSGQTDAGQRAEKMIAAAVVEAAEELMQPPTQGFKGFPNDIRWVAYSPTNFNPETGLRPDTASILKDLETLTQAGFTGLVTYGSAGPFGKELPRLAEQSGFQGLIMGIWDIASEEETRQAKAAAGSKIVLGYCVGNEGLGWRYNLDQLSQAAGAMKLATGKPVATTEQLEDYADAALLNLGDWVFPNVHPYWNGQYEAAGAVEWTKSAYENLRKKTDKPILFKEVGFPTAGQDSPAMSEALQEAYYVQLAVTNVPFVYFEAFDQPWKNHQPVEPYWGLFKPDRSPKRLARRLMASR